MKVIIDSGSTKTRLIGIDVNKNKVVDLYFPGINPFYQEENEIKSLLQMSMCNKMICKDVSDVFFYGAGCSFDEKKRVVRDSFKSVFENASINVESDLLGAARSLFKDQKGVACIMGTGSNSCFYDGEKIAKNVSPLGFILGDEGSGAVLGKKLLSNYLKGLMSNELKDLFYEKYKMSNSELMDNVYKKPFPNRFLASLVPFVIENYESAEMKELVKQNIGEFFDRNIRQYELTEDLEISFVGSIAFQFKDVIQDTANKLGLKIGHVEKEPIDGLVFFHTNMAK